MSLTLNKVGLYGDDEDRHVFTFVLEGLHTIQTLNDWKTIESSEVNYGGHTWTVVCARKEDRFLGMFLKWRYADGTSVSSVSVKVKFTLTLIHRHDYQRNVQFATTQRFSGAQSLLGKTRFVAVGDLLDVGAGYVAETGRHAIVELTFNACTTYYEKLVDVSPPSRTRKNASGVYFDTTTFLLAAHRWYLRFYARKSTSNGLPAVYLYLAGKSKGVAVDVQFTLYLGKDCTEILTYSFGDYAKFDGFGKTLQDPLANVDRLTEVTVSVEIQSLSVYKVAPVRLFRSPASMLSSPAAGTGLYSSTRGLLNSTSGAGGSAAFSVYSGGATERSPGVMTSSGAASQVFQDHEGNVWKAEILRNEQQWLTIAVDKGVHHYSNNKTRILCWSAILLSRDPQRAADVTMRGPPVFGYFSNFIDENGYMMSFPIRLAELEDRGNAYVDENTGEILVRLNLLSLQTTPLSMRSSPRFDYQVKHLLKARQEVQASDRNLQDMREMSASRASLSLLDDLSISSHNALQYKSYESLEALCNNEMSISSLVSDDYSRPFIASLLHHLALQSASANPPDAADSSSSASCGGGGGLILTGRDVSVNGSTVSEDSSTESAHGQTPTTTIVDGDSQALVREARSTVADGRQHADIVAAIVKFIQHRVPLRISDVIEAGSIGTNTVTRSRTDVDIILISPDVPRDCQWVWLTAVLRSIMAVLQLPAAVGGAEQLPAHCTDWHVTSRALQFNCAGVDVDVMVTYDWAAEAEGRGYEMLYDVTCKQTTLRQRQWFSLGSAKLQKKIVTDQPNEVKELIKVVKHWRNEVQWRRAEYRPNSYLLSLLVIKAVEETKSTDARRVIQRIGSYVLCAELRLSWSTFYNPDSYPVDFNPPTPLVRDPANPGVNVAQFLPYWGQLRTEFALWLRALNITISPLGS